MDPRERSALLDIISDLDALTPNICPEAEWLAAQRKGDSHPVPPGKCDCGRPETHRSTKP